MSEEDIDEPRKFLIVDGGSDPFRAYRCLILVTRLANDESPHIVAAYKSLPLSKDDTHIYNSLVKACDDVTTICRLGPYGRDFTEDERDVLEYLLRKATRLNERLPEQIKIPTKLSQTIVEACSHCPEPFNLEAAVEEWQPELAKAYINKVNKVCTDHTEVKLASTESSLDDGGRVGLLFFACHSNWLGKLENSLRTIRRQTDLVWAVWSELHERNEREEMESLSRCTTLFTIEESEDELNGYDPIIRESG